MKKTQIKDALRNIARQKVPWLSIVVIAMLAVMAYLGVNFGSRTIADNANAFYIETNFRDMEIVSTLLLTPEDLEAVRATEGVADAEGVYLTSGTARLGDDHVLADVVSLTRRVNVPKMLSGRLPETAEECVLDRTVAESIGADVGDQITLQSADGEQADYLLGSSFTVTGIMLYPDYAVISGRLPGERCIVVLPEAFDLDALDGCCMKAEVVFEKPAAIDRFSKAYTRLAKPVTAALEALRDERAAMRTEDIRRRYEEEISAGQKELDDAAAQLREARAELDDGAKEIAENQKKLEEAAQKLREALDELADGEAELALNQDKLDKAADALQEARGLLADGKKQLDDAKAELDAGERELADAKAELDDGARELADTKAELDAAAPQLANAKAQLEEGEHKLANAKKQLEDSEQQLADAEKELTDAERQLTEGKAELDEKKAELDDARAQLDAAALEIVAGDAELKRNEALLADGREQLAEAKRQLDGALLQLNVGAQELRAAEAELKEGKEQLDAAAEEIAAGEAELADGRQQLLDGYAKIEDGKENVRDILRSGLRTVLKRYVSSDYMTDDDVDMAITSIPWSRPGGPPDLSDPTLDVMWFQVTDDIGFHMSLFKSVSAVMENLNSILEGVMERLPDEARAIALELKDAVKEALRVRVEEEWGLPIHSGFVENMEQWNVSHEQYLAGEEKLREGREEYEAGAEKYETALKAYDEGCARYEDGKRQYEQGLAEYEAGLEKFERGSTEFQEGQRKLEEGRAAYETGEAQYAEGLAQWNEGKAQYEEALAQYSDGRARYEEGLAAFETGKAEYADGLKEFNEKKAQYEDALAKYEDGRRRYADGLKEYEQGRETYEEGLAKYNDGLAEYLKGKARYDDSEREYLDGLREYEDGLRAFEKGKQAYDEGLAEYEKGRVEYADGEKQLADGQRKLSDGEREYAEGLAEYEKGESRLSEARRTLYAMDPARWVLLSVGGNGSYVVIENAVRNIADMGVTFALVFILVGALVIISTVGRIVDEQRRLVGATKALGLFNREILAKYLIFGVSATVLGMLLGALGGYLIIQRFVVNSYSQFYVFPMAKLSYRTDMTLAVIAGGLILSTAAIWGTCSELLRSTATNLMQEKAPSSKLRAKPGRRARSLYARLILLNIRTDKKRVAVTVVSVAGCCTLLVAGFTMRSAIMGAIDRQYTDVTTYDAQIRHDPTASDTARGEILEILDSVGAERTELHYDIIPCSGPDGKLSSCELICGDLAEMDRFFIRRDAATDELLPADGEGCFIYSRLSETTGVSQGDSLTVYDSAMAPYNIPVLGVYHLYLGQKVLMSEQSYRAVFGTEPEKNAFFVNFPEGSAEQALERIRAVEGVTQVDDSYTMHANSRNTASVLNGIAVLLTVVAGMMAYFILLNLANMYVNQKKRELTIMRINGFTVREVKRYVAGEAVATTVIGILLGLGLGTLLGSRIVALIEAPGLQFVRTVQWMSWAWAALITGAFSVMIYLLSLRKVKHLKLTDIA